MFLDYNGTFESVPGQKEVSVVSTRVPPISEDYPTLFLEMRFKANAKTHRVNPATVNQDVLLRAYPYDNYEPANDFNAPHIGLQLKVENEIVRFEFHYTVYLQGGSMKVSGGFKEFFNIEKEVTTTHIKRALVLIKGELNTVHKFITVSAVRM